MDFMNRGFRNGNQETNNVSERPSSGHSSMDTDNKPKESKKSHAEMSGLKKVGSLGFLLALLIIVIGVIFAMITFRTSYGETKLVDTSKYQAVFLNGGQVYFGNVQELNSKYIKLGNIYYLRVNQQVQPNSSSSSNNDVSLVKLGCELHGPQDMMTINRDQVVFWENLKSDGQVNKAIDEYKKQYPNGEDCTKQASSSNSSSTSNSTSTTSGTSNTSNTSTNKTSTTTSR